MTIVHATDFGAVPDDDSNALPALRAAVAQASRVAGATLLIEPGVYRLRDEDAVTLQEEVLSGLWGNPEGRLFNRDFEYITALTVSDAENFTIDATGVTFLIDGWMETLAVYDSRGVTIQGLTIDLLRTPISEGTITAVGPGTIDVHFDGDTVHANMPFLRTMVHDDAAGLLGTEAWGAAAQNAGPGVLRFNLAGEQFAVGRTALFWHGFHFRPAILLYLSDDTVLRDVTIHANPGMGIVGHLCDTVTMERLRIVPRPGRITSTNTDATHFVSCRGLIRFDGCEFAGHGDDATNVHSFYTDILSVSGSDSCTLDLSRKFETHSVKRDFPRTGDILAVVRRDSLEEVAHIRVASVQLDPNSFAYTIRFVGALPPDIQNHTLINLTANPALEVVNTTVRTHRARCVLVKTRQALIENCTFDNATGTAIHIGAEGHWLEGPTSSDVIIRGNVFTRCGSGEGTIGGASAIAVQVDAARTDVPGLHKRILIEGNRVVGGQHAISISAAEDVLISGNTFAGITGDAIVVSETRRLRAYDNAGAEPLTLL